MPFLEMSKSLLFIYMDLVANTVRGWLSLRLEVTLQKKLWSSKAMYNKRKPPTVPFSGCRDPNSSVSHKVPWLYRPDLLHHPTTIPKKNSQMWGHLHFKYTSSFSITSNASYHTTKAYLPFLLRGSKGLQSIIDNHQQSQRIFLPLLIN